MKIIDLSFPIRPHFRWPVARDIRSSHARGDNFESSVMTLACLTNLDQIGVPRCRFLALLLKIEGADGSPVRAVAFVD